jgi:potassium efflux system protein
MGRGLDGGIPRLIAVCLVLAAPSYGQGPQPGSIAQASTVPEASHSSGLTQAELSALRAELAEQIKALAPAPAQGTAGRSLAAPARGSLKGSAPSAVPAPSSPPEAANEKALREVLEERLRLIDGYAKAKAALHKVQNIEPSPEQRAAAATRELQRLHALWEEAGKHPDALVPDSLRSGSGSGGSAVGGELKGALEAATAELKGWKSRLEALRAEAANEESVQIARRAERDKLFQRVAAIKVRGTDREAPAGAAPARGRRLAQERSTNVEWEGRVAALRLGALEAQLGADAKLKGVRELEIQACQARILLGEKTVELLQERYRLASELQEQQLKAKAAGEEETARRSQDPLERFRARRLAELLDLEAQVVKTEQMVDTDPPPSLDEQRSLADRAEADFARIKKLLDDGRVSRLDAIRLNNEFRRIGPERDRLLRNEMAVVEARLQYFEDALTNVELELLQDSLHDRFEQDLVRERLPQARWAVGEAVLAELEQKHRGILARRRSVLERLTGRTGQTVDQIARRLGILEEEYGFIRTHLFWVRDEEPLGTASLGQAVRESQIVLKGLLRLGQDAAKIRQWGSPSAEFAVGALAIAGLPFVLVRLRRYLRQQIARDLSA